MIHFIIIRVGQIGAVSYDSTEWEEKRKPGNCDFALGMSRDLRSNRIIRSYRFN